MSIENNTSISSIIAEPTESLKGLGQRVGNNGKYSVEETFTTFKNNLESRGSKDALSTLQNLKYRKLKTIETSSFGKFFSTLGQMIADICHNFRVAMYSTSAPAFDITVPLEQLLHNLTTPSVSKGLKKIPENAQTYCDKMAQNLFRLKSDIMEELNTYNRGKMGKEVLAAGVIYINEIIDHLPISKPQEMKLNMDEIKGDMKAIFKSALQKIEGASNKISENTKQWIQSIGKGIKSFGGKVENFGNKMQN